MTPEQRTAFINAQTALFLAEIEAMKAENQFRNQQGLTVAYTEKEFNSIIQKYEPIIGYNAVIEFFRGL